MTSADALIRYEDVSVAFPGGPVVLKGVDFEVRPREFVTLYGASGCGKSTLLNVVAGLLRPAHGAVYFSGAEVSGVNTRVGYMTQDDTLLPWKTVASNIAMPLRIRRKGKAEIRERVDFYLDLLNLTAAAKKYPAQLSGGMKRRALLARSMIYEPEVLLMDEPFGALDASLREDLHVEVRSAVERLEQTVLFVTHDLGEAALLSDRVLLVAGDPAGIAEQFEIPFGRGRDVAALRFDERFFDLERSLRRALGGRP